MSSPLDSASSSLSSDELELPYPRRPLGKCPECGYDLGATPAMDSNRCLYHRSYFWERFREAWKTAVEDHNEEDSNLPRPYLFYDPVTFNPKDDPDHLMGWGTNNLIEILQHMRQMHSSSLHCIEEGCSEKNLGTVQAYYDHLGIFHFPHIVPTPYTFGNKAFPYACTACPQVFFFFTDHSSLNNHHMYAHNAVVCEDLECDDEFQPRDGKSAIEVAASHHQNHHRSSETPIRCEVCTASCDNRQAFRDHHTQHVNVRRMALAAA